ncbi:MAG TPA: Na/Pi cotransporter family protein [Kiritimatiellia bacterium]|nr:Na/Pi cotransporter family protein [Kiritimatiellia bacterium]
MFKLTGGIGLFLMGMVLLTDGLKAYAGDALRRALVRFTGTPRKAFFSGALVTAVVQSSSATTVAVIGFVSAGLITFPQAIGVVFGASLGTTGTGWIISVLGLKVSVGYYALPLVGIGAFMKLLGRGRNRSLGLAVAGFGLIFIGIETLQDGMRGLSEVFDLSSLPSGGLPGHLLAMVIGIVMTVVMQSSSAAVATTLTALHAEAIHFEQAASLVIGAAIGTTITGALAAIGGNISAKRTAAAHVSFNLATGLIAILFLPLFLRGIGWAQEELGLDPGATSLAAFHTAFVGVGVIIFLPFAFPFARLIERLLPERGMTLTRHLDGTLLRVPSVALEATRRVVKEAASDTFGLIDGSLGGAGTQPDEGEITRLRHALDQTATFFRQIPPIAEDEPLSSIRISQMHAMEHLSRLLSHASPPPGVGRRMGVEPFKAAVGIGREILILGARGLRGDAAGDWVGGMEHLAMSLADLRRKQRPLLLQKTALGTANPEEALEVLDAMRWLDRVCYHGWRICHHLAGRSGAPPDEAMASFEE